MTNIFLHVNDNSFLGFHCDWWWLWTILAFTLGAIFHYLLWGERGDKVDVAPIEADRDRYHGLATKWEKDYQSLKYQLEESQKAEADLRAGLQRCEADKQLLSVAAEKAATDGATIIPTVTPTDNTEARGITGGISDARAGDIYTGLFTQDNFQIIEGIGPKINQVLIDAGYRNWSELARAEPADLRRHLDAAGKNFSLSDPSTWPHQASLAAAGDWDELIRYQKFTDGGRENTGSMQSDSKFEKLATTKLGFSSSNPDDLKVVEGIGPKIEGLLKADGITTWSELAAADVSRIQDILNNAGSRYKLAQPRTWPQQASLAAAGNWSELKTLQEDLKGGV